MQDAENVFELQPAQRVQVFKHLFGLVGIDHAKEIISAKRKELQTTIKVKGDTEQSSIKLRTAISTVVTLLNGLESITQIPKEMIAVIQKIITQSFFSDIKLIQENIQIEQFSIEDIDQSLFDSLQTEIENYKAMAASLQGKLDQLEQTLAAGESDVISLRTQIDGHQRELEILNDQLANIDTTKLQLLKKEIKDLQLNQQKISQGHDLNVFATQGYEVTDLLSAANLLEQLKSQGVQLNAQLETIQLKQTQLEKDYQNELTKKQQLEEQLAQLSKEYDDENKFHCDLIKADCPYIKVIKKEGADLLVRQQKKLEQQLAEISIQKDEEAFSKLEKQQAELQSEIKKIRALFELTNRKSIIEDAKSYAELQRELTAKTNQLTTFEHEIEQQATAKEKQAKLQATIEAKQEQLEQITAKQGTSKELLQQYCDQVNNLQLDQIVRVEK